MNLVYCIMELADIHCHILPYVDDGAQNLGESLDLLQMQAEQGVRTICLTPHLRQGMFDSSDEKIQNGYQRLREEAEKEGIPIRLFLSREYFYDHRFRDKLSEGTVLPMPSGTLLVEFSYPDPPERLLEAARLVTDAGYHPLFAHVERYHAVQDDPELAEQLISMGVKLQLNCSSILGREGVKQKKLCKRLLKARLPYVVCSDAHDTEVRRPELGKCAAYLEKKFGRAYAEELLHTHPLAILNT